MMEINKSQLLDGIYQRFKQIFPNFFINKHSHMSA